MRQSTRFGIRFKVAAAAAEQAQGIGEVDQGLGQVDQVTQQNTTSGEESAAASEELSAQAARMKQMLERFTLKDMGPPRSRAIEMPSLTPSLVEAAWEGVPLPAPEDPSQAIALDDEEFGKY